MASAGAAEIEFRLLGPIEAARNGGNLPLGGPRQRALLALLLLEPGARVSADRLVEELWRSEPPPGAAGTLRSYVSRLRRTIGSDAPVTASGSGYAIHVTPDRIDAVRFQQLIDEGRAALSRGAVARAAERLGEALELWRGSPFGDLADQGMLRAEAARLEELRILALEERLDAELALGRDAALVDELETLVAEHPYRERLWRQLMLALYRSERQADALAAYRRARSLLDEDLGLEPSEELRQLEQAILRHDVEPARVRPDPHNLPAAVTSFVGRGSELADVSALLQESRLLTLTGVGGAGKTRLALEAAARSTDGFSDGVFFADLSGLAEPGLVTRHVAGVLELQEQSELEVVDLVVRRLREAELLLVLDNCEHVREACAELAQHLLGACRRLRILATSREVLGSPGEVDYPVPPLALPPADADPDELRRAESVRLFLTRARAARPQLTEDDAAFETAARICSKLDGLPLALELAAARAKALSLDEIAARLSDRFRFLVSWRRVAPARHRTLREAMDWSYELLGPREQAMLCRLSVFAGGFTLAAAAAVCTEDDEEHALELVEHLVDASLVVAEERATEMRYRLLETVREYARERLAEVGAEGEVAEQHARYFFELAESGSPFRIQAHEVARWFERFDTEHDNLRGALRWFATSEDADSELRLAGSLWRFWYVRGHLTEGRRRLEDALGRGGGTTQPRAPALKGLAGITWSQNDLEAADAYAEQALVLARELGDGQTAYTALTVRIAAATARHDLETSTALCLEAEETARQSFPEGRGLVGFHRGDIAWLEERLDDAEQLYEEALAFARELGHSELEAFSLDGLGRTALKRGAPDEARDRFMDALAGFEQLAFKRKLAECLDGLAAATHDLGDSRRAASLLGTADAFGDEVGGRSMGWPRDVHAALGAQLRRELGPMEFGRAYSEGRERKRDSAITALASSNDRNE